MEMGRFWDALQDCQSMLSRLKQFKPLQSHLDSKDGEEAVIIAMNTICEFYVKMRMFEETKWFTMHYIFSLSADVIQKLGMTDQLPFIHVQLNELELAMEEFENLATLSKDDYIRSQSYLGYHKMLNGDSAEAIKILKKINLHHTKYQHLDVFVWHCLGICFMFEKKFGDALKYLTKCRNNSIWEDDSNGIIVSLANVSLKKKSFNFVQKHVDPIFQPTIQFSIIHNGLQNCVVKQNGLDFLNQVSKCRKQYLENINNQKWRLFKNSSLVNIYTRTKFNKPFVNF